MMQSSNNNNYYHEVPLATAKDIGTNERSTRGRGIGKAVFGATVVCLAVYGVVFSWRASSSSSAATVLLGATPICTEKQKVEHPALCHMLQRAEDDLDALVQDMQAHAAAHGLLVGENWQEGEVMPAQGAVAVKDQRHLDTQLPVVFAHGMGDSCFNSGMQHITQRASDLLGGVYATCIATGKTQAEDTKNGYFLNMDASVDVFAASVAVDPNLKDGFHAIGFSQGNNVIRGYIARYNSPAVHTFISVNGVNAGEGAVPYCRPSAAKTKSLSFDMCDYLMEQASRSAYTEFAQEHSFQANYWRDARPEAFARYQKYSQLAKWNNEAGFINQTLVENWSKTQGFVWVLAEDDGMVWPKEGEHWGYVSGHTLRVCSNRYSRLFRLLARC